MRERFLVSGVPVTQGSKRLVRGRMIEASPVLRVWRDTIATAARVALVEGRVHPVCEGPVGVGLVFHLPRGRTVRRVSPHVKPDLDKCVRAVFDALTVAGVWGDDGQVVWLRACKRYSVDGWTGVEIFLESDT